MPFQVDQVLTAALMNNVAPPGIVLPYAGAAAPTGWLLCDGAAVSRTAYLDLFTAIGTAYGVGDGSTTFNVPDLRGRVPVGKGTHADVNALNNNDGSAIADRRPKHKHTQDLALPNHVHSISNAAAAGHVHSLGTVWDNYAAGGAKNATDAGTSGGPSGGTGASVGNPTSNPAITGGVGPQTNVPTDGPAYTTLNYIIRANIG